MRVWLVYVRKSVVRVESDLESPERQLHICNSLLQFSETQPYITELYQDLDRSGSTEVGRDDWLRLKQQLSRPEVAGVISYSLDRIYRNVSEFLTFLNELERQGKALKTARENLDTSGPLGRFVVTILMALYEMEWRLTSVRMADMIEHKRRNQGRHWGTAPFGTERDVSGQLIPSQRAYIHDGEGRYYHDALRECFQFYATGLAGYEQVALALNLSGWRFWQAQPGPLGQKGDYSPTEWDSEKVRSVVNRWRIYRGDLPLGNPLKNQNVEWIPGGHQPILPIELCDTVGAVLNDRRRRLWNRNGNTRRIYILSDITHCGNCGMQLIGSFQKRRLYRHRWAKGGCSEGWVNADAIEAELITAVADFLHHPHLFNNIQLMLRQLNRTTQPDNLEDKLTDARAQLSRLEDIYLTDGGISKETYLIRRQRLLAELAELETQLLQSGNGLTQLTDQIWAGLKHLEDAEPKTQKALVSKIFQRLDISNSKITGLTPQPWAIPFFSACSKWAGWESNPTNTIELPDTLRIIGWYINVSSEA